MTPFTSCIDAAGIPFTVCMRDVFRLFIVFNSVIQADGLTDGETDEPLLGLTDGLALGELEGL